jgi:hypothetical protein
MNQKLDLLELTLEYTHKKTELDKLERQYDMIYSQKYMSQDIQGHGNAASRDAAIKILMETDHIDLLNILYDLRGECRNLYLIREALIEIGKQERSKHHEL